MLLLHKPRGSSALLVLHSLRTRESFSLLSVSFGSMLRYDPIYAAGNDAQTLFNNILGIDSLDPSIPKMTATVASRAVKAVL